MIVKECVVAILGALESTYPTRTLSLFKLSENAQNYRIVASIAPGGSDHRSMNLNSQGYPRLNTYVESSARIRGKGNVFEICPTEVTLKDCEQVYPMESKEYMICSNLVERKVPATLFSHQRSKKRSSTELFKEVNRRNQSPANIECFNSLLNGNILSLSRLLDGCTHAIVRDLIYKGKVQLTGDHSCNGLNKEYPVKLNADTPLTIKQDTYFTMFENKKGYYFFTTDGMQILYLQNTAGPALQVRSRFMAVREGTEDTTRILDTINMMNTMNTKTPQILPAQDLKIRYQVCPSVGYGSIRSLHA